MAISHLPILMDRLPEALADLGAALDQILRTSGDMPLRWIDEVFRTLATARVIGTHISNEIAALPAAAADAVVASYPGLPGNGTAATLRTELIAMATAANAWETMTLSALRSIPDNTQWQMVAEVHRGVTVRFARTVTVIPSTMADTYRANAAVQAFRDALTSAGG